MNKIQSIIVSVLSILVLLLSIVINNIKLDDVFHIINDENHMMNFVTLSKNKKHNFYEYLIFSSSSDLYDEYQQAYEFKEMEDYSDDIERYNRVDDINDNNFYKL